MSWNERGGPALMREARVDALVAELGGVLAQAGVEQARREAADIVAAIMDRPRLWPSAHGDAPVSEHDAGRMRAAARRRAGGTPFAYAVARAAFRHLTLAVDERVLIPRVETEELVSVVLEETAGSRPAEVCGWKRKPFSSRSLIVLRIVAGETPIPKRREIVREPAGSAVST